jgi:dolichol-phosphate mannosyltransferase
MDADLQDPPEVLTALIEKWREGYDVVYAVRSERKGEGFIKRKTAALFYRLLRTLAKIDLPLDTGDFRLMSRRAVDALLTVRERHRFVRGLSLWVGFRQTSVSFIREARYAGCTKYPLPKMLRFAFDGISSFSLVPLQLATYLGLGAASIGVCAMVYALGVKLFTSHAVPGWASLIVVTLFLGGVQLVTIGIVGAYVGRIYEEVKQRPLYIVAETKGFDETGDPVAYPEKIYL